MKHGFFVLGTQYSEMLLFKHCGIYFNSSIIKVLRNAIYFYNASEYEDVTRHIVDKIGRCARCGDCNPCFEMGFLKCSMQRLEMALKSWINTCCNLVSNAVLWGRTTRLNISFYGTGMDLLFQLYVYVLSIDSNCKILGDW